MSPAPYPLELKIFSSDDGNTAMAPAAVAAAAFPFRLFSVEARRDTRNSRGKRGAARPLKSSQPPAYPSSSSSVGGGGGGGAATTFTRLPLLDEPDSAEVTLDRFPTAPANPETQAPAFTRGNVERLDGNEEEEEVVLGATTLHLDDDGEEELVVSRLDIFDGKKGRKSRAIVPEVFDEDGDVVVFDPDFGADSDDEEETETFPIKWSPKGGAIARTELGAVDYDDAEENDEEEVVVFHPDYDDDDEEEDAFEDDDDYEDEEEGEGEEGEMKEKGVPAVMRCFDTAKIYAKAGDGGNGVVAFRREKYVPYGGPSGGDGGRGGNVYVEVDGEMNSLLPFRKSLHFRAGRGAHGMGQQQAGAKGEDVVVKVPPGTVVRSSDGGVVLLELMKPGQRALLLPGGRGGRGNAAFKSGTNKVPRIAEKGEQGPEMYVLLPRKIIIFSHGWNELWQSLH